MDTKTRPSVLVVLIILIVSACRSNDVASEFAIQETPVAEVKPTKETLPTTIAATETVITFDPTSVNRIAPADVLKEVTYMGTGGGYLCRDPLPPYTKPTIVWATESVIEIPAMIRVMACGWQENEEVTMEIQYPDGRIAEQVVQAELDDVPANKPVYRSYSTFKPEKDDPDGTYTFNLVGQSGKVSTQITYVKSDGPRVYELDAQHIILLGFEPNEQVKIYGYFEGSLVGWEEYQVNSQGELSINVPTDPNNSNFYFAIGDQSGEVRMKLDLKNGPIERSIFRQIECGGLKSRLLKGDIARVAYTDGSNMRIREKPGFSQSVLNKVPEGTKIEILDGPRCADNSTWWRIRTETGIEGWMTEEQDSVYLIELLP